MLGLVCLSVFSSSLFDVGYFIEEVYLIPSLTGFIWSVLLFIMLNAFVNMPIKSDGEVGFFTRVKYGLARLGYSILAIIFLLMSVAGLILSFRLFSVWFTH
jgi:hypothetical protein